MGILEAAIFWCAIGAAIAGLAAVLIDRFRRPVATVLALLAAVGPWVHWAMAGGALGGGLVAVLVALLLPPVLFVAAWSRYDVRQQLPNRRSLMVAAYFGILLSSAYALAWAPILVMRLVEKVAG